MGREYLKTMLSKRARLRGEIDALNQDIRTERERRSTEAQAVSFEAKYRKALERTTAATYRKRLLERIIRECPGCRKRYRERLESRKRQERQWKEIDERQRREEERKARRGT